MDSVGYLNLSNIKGLQVYDNPLIAEKQSTYSCKNVYTDEHGNLTVRPALKPVLDMTGDWQYVFQDGSTLTMTGDTVSTWINKTKRVNGQVVPVERNDRKYVFLQDKELGCDVLYDITDGNFTKVQGITLFDDLENSDISHYNILNDKVAVFREDSFRDATSYDVIAECEIGTTGEWQLYPGLAIRTSAGALAEENKIDIVRYDGLRWNRQTIVLEWTLSHYSDIFTTYIDGLIYVSRVSYGDNLVEPDPVLYLEVIKFTHDNTMFKTMYRFEDDDLATLNSGGEAIPAERRFGIVITSTYAVCVFYTKLETVDNDTEQTSVHFRRYDMQTSTKAINNEVYLSMTSAFVQISEFDNTFVLLVGEANGYTHVHVYDTALEDLIYTDSGKAETKLGVTYRTSTEIKSIWIGTEPYNLPLPIPVDSPIMVQRFGNIVAIGAYNGKIHYEIDTVTKAYTYYTDGMSLSIDNGTFAFTQDRVVTRKYLYPSMFRPVDQVPVLNNINEQVVTGFFLDNTWWFVTEHSIFGTGVDENGMGTIEMFDPLKYFKVSERIMGALRISDTSFWVFHNTGAYLIYKSAITLSNGTEYRWLYTATAKSKGCDFENAIWTLPVSSAVVTVTAEDICNIQMRENVQSDERILVPMTTQFSALIRQLLAETESVKIWNHKYLTIFALNPKSNISYVPAVVFDNMTNSWWYWEFPVEKILSIQELDDTVVLHCYHDNTIYCAELTEDEYLYKIGSLQYEIYADKLVPNSQTPTQIEWSWQSAVQTFNTIEFHKQLLFTTFVFDDYAPDEYAEQLIEIGYYFDIYSRDYITSQADATTVPVYRVSNRACRTSIGRYNYLQLNLHHVPFESTNFEVMTKPKICCISMKYRTLRGEL
jgi:hypothetical protein